MILNILYSSNLHCVVNVAASSGIPCACIRICALSHLGRSVYDSLVSYSV